MLVNTVKIKIYEKLFTDNEFRSILGSRRHKSIGMITKNRIDVVSKPDPWLCHEDLDRIISSNALGDEAKALIYLTISADWFS